MGEPWHPDVGDLVVVVDAPRPLRAQGWAVGMVSTVARTGARGGGVYLHRGSAGLDPMPDGLESFFYPGELAPWGG